MDGTCFGQIDNDTGLYTLQLEFSYSSVFENISLEYFQEAVENYLITVDNTNGLGRSIPISRETIDIERVQV